MSTTHTQTRPKGASLAGRIFGGATLAAILAAATIALWPASEAEKARDDGEQLGQAVGQLQSAQSSEEVDAALTEVQDAVQDSRDHAGDRVGEQVDDQAEALDRAVDSYYGAVTTDDDFEAEIYEAELEVALDDLANNASDFREEGPEVVEAYWEGFEDGLPED